MHRQQANGRTDANYYNPNALQQPEKKVSATVSDDVDNDASQNEGAYLEMEVKKEEAYLEMEVKKEAAYLEMEVKTGDKHYLNVNKFKISDNSANTAATGEETYLEMEMKGVAENYNNVAVHKKPKVKDT